MRVIENNYLNVLLQKPYHLSHSLTEPQEAKEYRHGAYEGRLPEMAGMEQRQFPQ